MKESLGQEKHRSIGTSNWGEGSLVLIVRLGDYGPGQKSYLQCAFTPLQMRQIEIRHTALSRVGP